MAKASIRRAAAPFFSLPAAARSAEALKSSRVIAIAAAIEDPLAQESSIDSDFRRFGNPPTSQIYRPLVSFDSGLELETFAIPKGQRDAIAEGIEKVVLPVASSVANTKALDLIDQVIS